MYSDAQAAARPAKCFLDFSILSLLMLAAFQFLALDFFMAFALSLGFHAIVPCWFFVMFFSLVAYLPSYEVLYNFSSIFGVVSFDII